MKRGAYSCKGTGNHSMMETEKRPAISRTASFVIVTLIYLAAAAIGILLYRALPFAFWLNLLLSDVAATVFTGSCNFRCGFCHNSALVLDSKSLPAIPESEILDYIFEYSTRATSDRDHVNALAAWIALLGRGNRNLQDTLDGYLYKTMKDWEAAITALRYEKVAMAAAVTKVKSHLHSIYTMPEVRAAFKKADDFKATYIRSKGVQKGGVGLSNNGSTNVTNMAKLTLQMAWMREQGIEFDESGAAGYYQLRGSSYPCSLCDDEVGFHKGLEGLYTKPYPHPHCCCYRVPIYLIENK